MEKKNIYIAILVAVTVLASAFYFIKDDVETISSIEEGQEREEATNQEVIVEQNSEVVAATTTLETVAEEEAVVKPVSAKPAQNTTTPSEPAPVVVSDPAPAPVVPSGITMSEVRLHADASSCWSVVDGAVYDLTTYIPKHPGGKGEILAICGEDGSQAFAGQHSGDSKPERILASYKIGDLSN